MSEEEYMEPLEDYTVCFTERAPGVHRELVFQTLREAREFYEMALDPIERKYAKIWRREFSADGLLEGLTDFTTV